MCAVVKSPEPLFLETKGGKGGRAYPSKKERRRKKKKERRGKKREFATVTTLYESKKQTTPKSLTNHSPSPIKRPRNQPPLCLLARATYYLFLLCLEVSRLRAVKEGE